MPLKVEFTRGEVALSSAEPGGWERSMEFSVAASADWPDLHMAPGTGGVEVSLW